MIRLASGLVSVSLIVLVATAGGVWWLESWLDRPGPLSESITVILEPGIGVQSIANQLAKIEAVENAQLFVLAVTVNGNRRSLKAGEYTFPVKAKPRTILEMLASGRTLVHKLTVPEGLTKFEVIELIQSATALSGIVETAPLEGWMLPETYHFSRGEKRNDLIERMEIAMQDALKELWTQRPTGLPYSEPAEALVMASIIEKETSRASERSRVAAVFVNRLRLDMLLQSDPTGIYSLTEGEGRLGRPLTRADLRNASAYNTYLHIGLPPGAITNPGRDSIIAALNPDETDELYFVGDGDGGHRFARTLIEHNHNVAHFRRVRSKARDCVAC